MLDLGLPSPQTFSSKSEITNSCLYCRTIRLLTSILFSFVLSITIHQAMKVDYFPFKVTIFTLLEFQQ